MKRTCISTLAPAAAVAAIAVLSCGGGSGGGGQSSVACSYTEDSDLSCGNGSPGSSHQSTCVEVDSADDCTTLTQDNSNCTEGCCSSSRFSNVTATPGPCPQAGGGADAGSDAGACPVTSSTSTCDACLFQNCCPDLVACKQSSDCTAYSACLQPCTTTTCESTCESQHPSGSTVYAQYNACGTKYCTTACP